MQGNGTPNLKQEKFTIDNTTYTILPAYYHYGDDFRGEFSNSKNDAVLQFRISEGNSTAANADVDKSDNLFTFKNLTDAVKQLDKEKERRLDNKNEEKSKSEIKRQYRKDKRKLRYYTKGRMYR